MPCHHAGTTLLRARHAPATKSARLTEPGGIFSEVPQGTDPKNWAFCGSTLNVLADTREEVVELLKGDIYNTSGVWDVEKVSRPPFSHREMSGD